MTVDTEAEGLGGGPGSWTGPRAPPTTPPVLMPPDPLPCHTLAISLAGDGSAHSETGPVSQEGLAAEARAQCMEEICVTDT